MTLERRHWYLRLVDDADDADDDAADVVFVAKHGGSSGTVKLTGCC
jgi:hypothetical protein